MISFDSTTELPNGPQLSASETTFQWLARPFAFLDECVAEYGDTFTLQYKRFGTHVLVSHPDDVRQVFTGDPQVLHAGRGNALLEPILGRHSLLVLDGDVHAKERARLQATFRPDRTREYARLVGEATRRWTASWNGGSTVSMQRVALEISKEVIIRLVLGAAEDEVGRLSRLIDALMVLVGTNTQLDEPTVDGRVLQRFHSVRGALDAALQEHVDRRRRAPEGDDLLAMLLSARSASGAVLSDEEIRDQLITMLLAGHETTASSITWALLCLNEQPETLQKLVAELEGAGELSPTDGLASLPYLQAVCLETLRLRPVIPVVSRQLQEPFRLRDYTLPAGVFVTPSAYLAHRRTESFPQPDEFRPERFLDRRYSPYVYFPFGGGVRRCIGMSFALLEMQIVLGMLVRTFRIAPLGPVRAVRRAVTIVASGGAKMRVERRPTA